ncbi:MAG TPA: hypothetical protein VHC21_04780 [Candidatus Saccharimonadales bacterium]|nr:hypothetical protein [Candidatus Saccharimonadales bacterium]
MMKLPNANQETLPPDAESVINPVIDELVSALRTGSELRVAQATLTVGAAMVRAYDADAAAADSAAAPTDARTKFMVELDWTPYARSRLEAYAETHPGTAEVVKNSLFFAEDPRLLRTLGRVVSARAPQRG